jgi:hypothetical protein
MVTKMGEEEIKAIDSGDIGVRMAGQKADRDYLRTNYHDLLSSYRNQWVVISGGKLLKAEGNPDRLLKTLGEINKDDVLIFYMADPEDFMIL